MKPPRLILVRRRRPIYDPRLAIIMAAIALVIAFDSVAFVRADWGWLGDVWAWTSGERCELIFGAVTAAAFGVVGAWWVQQ